MKCVKLTLALSTLAFATADAATHYKFKIDTAMSVGDALLKPGEYTVDVGGGKAVFKSGKTVVEVSAAVQASDKKYSLSSYEAVDSRIVEIDLGGTNTKIVFGSAPAVAATK
ncbi:MAG TPA: hypothetical protein VKX49_08235 [Bryobacteraceae bacterium]|nr:hypothetical protein [Bryobacteraceae bacterium]